MLEQMKEQMLADIGRLTPAEISWLAVQANAMLARVVSDHNVLRKMGKQSGATDAKQ